MNLSLRIAVLTALCIPFTLSAAVPTSPPSSSAAPAGGYFSQYFSNIANGSFALANNIWGSTASVCGTNGIIVGFNTTPGNSFLSPQCKNLSSLLPSLVGTILTSTTGTAGQAVTGFTSTGAPIYGNVSSSDAPVWAIMPFMLTSCPVWWIAANGTNGTVDLRGEFVRWLDSGRWVDAARTLWSWQVDMFKSHNHTVNAVQAWYSHVSWLGWWVSNNSSNTPTSYIWWTETRPRNVALLYCQKLTSNSTPSSNVTWTNTTGTNAGNVVQATTGNVGIGTINPTAKLEVNGNIIANTPTAANHVATKAYVDANGGGLWNITTVVWAVSACRGMSYANCPPGYTVISWWHEFVWSCGCAENHRFPVHSRPYGNSWGVVIECATSRAVAVCVQN